MSDVTLTQTNRDSFSGALLLIPAAAIAGGVYLYESQPQGRGAPSRNVVHGVAALISYASKAFTLLPGDVILTGTPAGAGPVVAGQRVEIEIDAIGTLSNPFVAADR